MGKVVGGIVDKVTDDILGIDGYKKKKAPNVEADYSESTDELEKTGGEVKKKRLKLYATRGGALGEEVNNFQNQRGTILGN